MDRTDSIDETREVRPDDESRADDPARDEDDDEESAAAIAECLKLLDEVWPGDSAPVEDRPRELGRFRILGELGRGGFGVVFLAEDPTLGRRVALKVPRVEILTGSESWRRFLREVRAAARLDHANLVPLLEAGTIGPVGYIVSAYIPGPSLEQWLRRHPGGAQPRWAARLILALARAIHHAHGRNILHRDLKPGNVLLDAGDPPVDPADPASWAGVPAESWIPRICDFGLAKLFEVEEEETRSRVVCGSPPYMAPEQADSRRDEIGPATDVYGLGAILYELLTGRPPFGGKSHLETLRRVATEEPVAPRRRRPGIPRDLETICLKCLGKRPEARYAAAADLADDLERFLDGRPIAARPTPAWERAARWARRNPAAAVLASAVLLSTCAGLCGLLWHSAVLGEKNEALRREALRAERHAQEADGHRKEADRRAAELRRQLAGSQLFQAQQAAASGEFEPARRLLEAAAAEFGRAGAPSFAWRYLEGSIRDHIQVLPGHEEEVACATASPDGRSLASGDIRGRIRIWDLGTGRVRLEFSGGTAAIDRLAWSRDGRTLASADRETGSVLVWDLASGRCRGHLDGTGGGEPVWWLGFSGDGRGITAVRARRDPARPPIEGWDLTGPSGEFPGRPAADSPNRADARLRHLVDLLDAGSSGSGPMPAIEAGGAEGPAVASTADRALAVLALDGSTFEVYRGGSRFRLALIRSRTDGHDVVFLDQFRTGDRPSRAERKRLEQLATGLVPDWRKGRSPRGAVLRAEGSAASLFGPDAGQLVIWDEVHDVLSLVGPGDGPARAISELGPLAGVRALCLDPGRTTIVLGSEDGRIRLWRAHPRRRMVSLKGHAPREAWAVAFSPDGRTLASGGDDNRVRLWDAGTGDERSVIHEHIALITSLAFSPDGRTLAIGSFDRRKPAMLWDLAAGRPGSILSGHRDWVRCVAFDRDGSTLATSGEETSIMLWDPRDGRRKAAYPLGRHRGPARLALSPDGRTIAATNVHEIGLVERDTGTNRPIAVDEPVASLVYTPDGSMLIAGFKDGSIRSWEVASGRPIRAIQGHAGDVLALALTPDGATLASAGQDRTVRVWDVATGQELLCLTDCRARVNSVAFSPDGQVLAAADHSGAVTIWDARPRR